MQPNSPNAVANVANEQAYYQLLDNHCSDFQNTVGGGVGWFAHIYSDNQEPGYGIYGYNGQLKFPFAPKTTCSGTSTPPPPPPPPNGVQIHPNGNTGKCLDVKSGVIANGTPVQM